MKQWFAIAKHIYDAVDADLIRSYHTGLVLGLLIMTTLALFPGREPDWTTRLAVAPKKTTPSDEFKNPNNDVKQNLSPRPVELHGNRNNNDNGCTRTPHQTMNAVVYFLLLSLAAFILDHLYGGLISVLLQIYFPREASLLRFKFA